MKFRILIRITAVSLLATLMVSVRLAAQDQAKAQPPRYYVFNLGAPGGGTIAMAASINDIGWVAGDAYQTGNTTEHAELWVGSPFDLGTLGGSNSAVAWPNKNDRGEIAGVAETGETNRLKEDWSCALANFPTITHQICLGFAWQGGVMSPLPPLPGGLDSYASAVNNRGQVAVGGEWHSRLDLPSAAGPAVRSSHLGAETGRTDRASSALPRSRFGCHGNQ